MRQVLVGREFQFVLVDDDSSADEHLAPVRSSAS